MQKTLELFKKSRIIKKHTVLDYKSSSKAQYLKAKLELKNGDLIIRWDNSPHHKSLTTFPHHKHSPDLEESYETTFKDVINIIKKIMKKGR